MCTNICTLISIKVEYSFSYFGFGFQELHLLSFSKLTSIGTQKLDLFVAGKNLEDPITSRLTEDVTYYICFLIKNMHYLASFFSPRFYV